LAFPLAAQAQPGDRSQPQTAEIVQRDAAGHAVTVRIDGQDYPVCTSGQQDGCIEPYAAGLNWGNRPLPYWPGRPASEIDGDQGHIGG
jgi:hypothetical protein